MRAWAERCEADVAWIALDEADADVRAFAAYLDAAFRQAIPEFGRSVLELLEGGRAEADTCARALTNELLTATEERERDVVLFLDDFHTVQGHEGVRDLVAGLLRALPPRAHLAIASRFPLDFSPIVKLRAAGSAIDFTQNDLRFTPSEAAQLLASDRSERTPLQRDVLDSLVRRADGWAMALRLSLQAAPGLRGAAPAGGDSEHSLFAYLADEVLRAQPPEIRALLLGCAVPKTLDARTLERVMGVENGASALESLVARNLYLEPMAPRTYRFHHLFRDFLIATLRREEPERLHHLKLRYARLLEESGDLTGAVTQYMEAGDFASAADHVGDALIALKYGDNVDRIAAIFADLPDALKLERPFLLQLEATVRRRRRDFEGAAEAYERAARGALALQDFATACACTIERGMLAGDLRAGGHGRFEKSIELFAEALRYAERCGQKRDAYVKAASITMGLALAAQFDYEAAKPYLAEAERLQRAAATQRSDVMTTIATIDGWQGEWHRALEHAELAEDLLRSHGGRRLSDRARAESPSQSALLSVRRSAPRAGAGGGRGRVGALLQRTRRSARRVRRARTREPRATRSERRPGARSARRSDAPPAAVAEQRDPLRNSRRTLRDLHSDQPARRCAARVGGGARLRAEQPRSARAGAGDVLRRTLPFGLGRAPRSCRTLRRRVRAVRAASRQVLHAARRDRGLRRARAPQPARTG